MKQKAKSLFLFAKFFKKHYNIGEITWFCMIKQKSKEKSIEKKKPFRQEQITYILSLIVAIALAGLIFSGITYYLQTRAADTQQETAVSDVQNQMQQQIEELNNKISELEGQNQINEELLQKDLPEAAKAVENCQAEFENGYAELDEKISSYLKLNNRAFSNYQSQGYELKAACKSNEQILMFLDSQKTYDNAVQAKKATSEIVLVSTKIILGLADKMFYKINYYPVKIENYSFENENKTTCHFDQFIDNKILYICKKEIENGKEYFWYAFDKIKKLNKKVKIEKIFDDQENAQETFENELLEMFSRQSFIE